MMIDEAVSSACLRTYSYWSGSSTPGSLLVGNQRLSTRTWFYWSGTPMLCLHWSESVLQFYWLGTPMLGLHWSESEAEYPYVVLLVGHANAWSLLVGIKGSVLSFIGRGLLSCGLHRSESKAQYLTDDQFSNVFLVQWYSNVVGPQVSKRLKC
jgi:hypothetical protein